jgi:membrane associated rhomboid family serine protease
VTQPPGDVVSRCYRHPNREALIRCTRCDRPICPDCMRPASVGFHCPDDVSREAKTVRAPRTTVGARLAKSPPFVTIGLIVANVIVYLVTVRAPGGSFSDPGAGAASGKGVFFDWQLLPYLVKHQQHYYDLVTSAFLHASPLHIASNMLALAFVGPAVESVLGWWRFSAVYLLSALGGSAAIYAFGDELTPTVGASGAIFGLMGALLVIAHKVHADMSGLLGWIGANALLTFVVPNVSWQGHLGGFVGGLLLAGILVYAPKARRTTVQTAGVVALVVVLLAATAARMAALA